MLEYSFALEGKRVWVAGHKGMVGSAVVRRLATENCEIVTIERSDVDLTRQVEVETWIKDAGVDAIVMAAARVGGIVANDTYPAEFLFQNLMIEVNVTDAAHRAGVNRMLFLGSSCIYPQLAPQPIRENALLTGPLEPTNEWYAVAKIAGIKLCQAYRRQYGRDYISAMPTNLYGPGDNFDLLTAHVLPALIRKAHEAKAHGLKELVVWGSGTPRREFLHVDDCANALVHLLKIYSEMEHINVGSGEDVTILELAKIVAAVVGFDGRVVLDKSKPDGTPRKLMSGDKLAALGWKRNRQLKTGIFETYQWFLSEVVGE
jgi:GDP-L-fucose synthase